MEAAAIAPGDVLLGKYRVERVLGQGGMGVVVAARHLQLGELHAIKLLGADARRVPDAVARFLREARASARLRSEHVAKVHDVGHLDDGLPYMVMEHLTGHDLKEHLRKRGRLSVEETVALLLQACDAIAEAHSIGVIHRDLKPSNLFLTERRDGTACLKVLDFGIAKEISAEGADLTKSGTTLGSPLYMSPEQMMRSKGVDTRTDIWSLGVVLYELVTGQVPFQGDTITEIVAAVLQNAPKRPTELCGELPSWVDEVVLRCLEKFPEARFLTIDELAAALRRGGEVHASTDAAVEPTTKAPNTVSVDLSAGSPARLDDTPSKSALAVATTANANTPPLVADAPPAVPIAQEASEPGELARRDGLPSTTLAESTWGKTGGDRRPPWSKAGILAGAVLAIAVLGTVAIWLTKGQSSMDHGSSSGLQTPAASAESPATPSSPRALPTPAPTEPPPASSPPGPSNGATATAQPAGAASSAAQGTSPQPAPTTTKSGAGVPPQPTAKARDSHTAQPTATTIAVVPAPTASAQAPASSATKSKSAHEGVF